MTGIEKLTYGTSVRNRNGMVYGSVMTDEEPWSSGLSNVDKMVSGWLQCMYVCMYDGVIKEM